MIYELFCVKKFHERFYIERFHELSLERKSYESFCVEKFSGCCFTNSFYDVFYRCFVMEDFHGVILLEFSLLDKPHVDGPILALEEAWVGSTCMLLRICFA